MPRPCKRRRICAEPDCNWFGPLRTQADHQEDCQENHPADNQKDHPADGLSTVDMTLDEFETIRLIDLEGLTQEQCAERMGVARTTAQAIYNSARSKVAECLVRQRRLHIGGGDYVLCDGTADHCGHRSRHHCCQGFLADRETDTRRKKEMKIAVTYENGQIFQHFGHTEQFKVYEVQDGRVTGSEIIDAGGSGHGALAGFLKEHQVDALICGGIGGGARMALAEAGIELYGGAAGAADAAVEAFIGGSLHYNPDVTCDHHDHEGHPEGHDCGGHHGGGHQCGGNHCG